MSSVRECVEWGFGRVKTLWEFVNWDKKLIIRQTTVGKLFYIAVLLTNCHTCYLVCTATCRLITLVFTLQQLS
ncbi:hypothetical protein P43SY_011211 [Pythium insidiosum]|uniref:DDE Tnp4 domain-containing protein n=1 Tax=Pythium insidiosum TaxID=114742 RepID=A0AAD5L961_PYTIN|nr:hypothetical protein P43SY_011211 [Pythium insidiosum]